MGLPGFRKRRAAATPDASAQEKGALPDNQLALKQRTKTRKGAIIFSSICYMLAVIFLILVSLE